MALVQPQASQEPLLQKRFPQPQPRRFKAPNLSFSGITDTKITEKSIERTNPEPANTISDFTKHFHPLFEACENLNQVRAIHAQLLKYSFQHNINLSTKLVDYYTCHGHHEAARSILSRVNKTNLLSWNLLIRASSKNGQFGQCLQLFMDMRRQARVSPDGFTFPCVLNACTGLSSLPAGQAVHALIIKCGHVENLFISSALIHMYANCRQPDCARKVFDEMPERDLVSWNSIINGYLKEGQSSKALSIFSRFMLFSGMGPNCTTISSVLAAIGRISDLGLGQSVHGYVIKSGMAMEEDISVNSSLVFMYCKCKDLDYARQVFGLMPERNVVSWNTIVGGFISNGRVKEGWEFFKLMQLEGIEATEVTVTNLIMASTNLPEAKMIHASVIKLGFAREEVIGAALIDTYGKFDSVIDAASVFDEVDHRTEMGSWNSMILGYARNGYPREAIDLFYKLKESGLVPNSITMIGVLNACANLGALEQGKIVHDYCVTSGIEENLMVETALIDMYAKCGRVDIAKDMFEKMTVRDLVSWSVMIDGYGLNGEVKEAMHLFSRMVHDGFKPDHVTFTSILSACSHSGLVQEGLGYFNQMKQIYHLEAKVEQYACIVDLLGRAGRLDEALNFIQKMPIKPDVSVWGAILGACRIHNNIELGAYSAEKLFELDPRDAGWYVLLSNLYASAGRWNDVNRVRALMKARGLQKPPGRSWVDLSGVLHEFYAGDMSHPQSVKIYDKLKELGEKMKELGYVAYTDAVLHDVEEDDVKEDILNSHSERLAIAFGLININTAGPIRVTKNLRVCVDCHRATKLISKITERKIIVRDARRFHHFNDGVCSCGDYW